jgi:hypothetical protein
MYNGYVSIYFICCEIMVMVHNHFKNVGSQSLPICFDSASSFPFYFGIRQLDAKA